jgi:5-carboxymethyl-2-hydroxymuconate isomerase
MPHAILEYSQNILEAIDHHALFARLHDLMVSSGPISIADIKSRVYRADHFYIADGNPQNAFVHLRIEVLEGRDLAVRKAISEGALALLEEFYSDSVGHLQCQLSVEVREMARDTYSKIGVGGHRAEGGDEGSGPER